MTVDLLLDAIKEKIRVGDVLTEGTPNLEEIEKGKTCYLSAIAKLLLYEVTRPEEETIFERILKPLEKNIAHSLETRSLETRDEIDVTPPESTEILTDQAARAIEEGRV